MKDHAMNPSSLHSGAKTSRQRCQPPSPGPDTPFLLFKFFLFTYMWKYICVCACACVCVYIMFVCVFCLHVYLQTKKGHWIPWDSSYPEQQLVLLTAKPPLQPPSPFLLSLLYIPEQISRFRDQANSHWGTRCPFLQHLRFFIS